MTGDVNFETTVKRMLSAQTVDDDTVRRLDAARRAAVATVTAPAQRRLLPYAAAASVAVTALVATYLLIPGAPTAPPGEADDLEMLLAEDNFEVYEEMEFYQWLSVAGDES